MAVAYEDVDDWRLTERRHAEESSACVEDNAEARDDVTWSVLGIGGEVSVSTEAVNECVFGGFRVHQNFEFWLFEGFGFGPGEDG